LACNLVFAPREDHERNLFAPANMINEIEIGRREHAQILAILLVNSLDVLGNHQLDAGRKLGIGRLLATGSLASTFTADRRDKPALLHIRAFDRQLVTTLQACIRKLAQSLIE